MDIRPAMPSDFPTLLRIQTASIKSLTQTYQPEEIQAWIDFIEAEGPNRYASKQSALFGSEDDPHAFVSWSTEEGLGMVDNLFVLPQCQVKGTGSRLLAYAEDMLSVKSIRIRATLNAQSFYEKHGYSFVEFTTSRAGFAIAIVEKHR